ncbi:flagellin N-terminal helical domain-containing protein [Planococcus faecalis]|uniref:Flagellin n=1 Tax=Planococcus faecalis TaxID=1598147 RepID=A0ABM6IN71_9BACL|nr:flagellin [Planococcus faecalis]AQU77966.1 hypothetical protein AJGP001_01000 [Planococcus faecalis]OHX52173.1 hypothetical protein BB777_13195 [Planococcus faecalis]
MIINHNIAALNTHRQMGSAQSAQMGNMEKLSSGMRINRAADDAAGLTISEKMRGQIRGLEQGSRNAQDGISMIQTAEGALSETHDILQRMREVAVQSANGTNTDTDRSELQKEINQLAEEITRISTDTEFNTRSLLDGKFEAKFHVGANADQNISLSINKMDSSALKVAGSESAEVEQTAGVIRGAAGTEIANGTFKVVEIEKYEGTALTDDLSGGTISTAAAQKYVAVDTAGNAVATSEDGKAWVQYGVTDANAANRDTFSLDGNVVAGGSLTIEDTGDTVTANVGITGSKLEAGSYTVVDVSKNSSISGGFNIGLANANGDIIALGATNLSGGVAGSAAATTNWVDVKDTSKALLTTTANAGLATGEEIKVTGKGIDISSQASSNKAITIIQTAIESVSSERSKLGAMQNRLDHTINNLNASSENITAAESRIRDVDYAEAA